jgi:hypothetical protein
MSGDGWEDAVILIDGKPLEELLKKRGRRRFSIWADVIYPHFDEEVRIKGPFPSLGRARDVVTQWLEDTGRKVPHGRTIERRIGLDRPGWVLPAA